MIELTQEQQKHIDNGQAVEVVDPHTTRQYVVLRKDVYERVKQLLGDGSDWTHDELRLMLARAAEGNGWNEPEMDAYDRYDEERRKLCP